MIRILYRKHCLSPPLQGVQFNEILSVDPGELDLTLLGLRACTPDNPFKSKTGGCDFFASEVQVLSPVSDFSVSSEVH